YTVISSPPSEHTTAIAIAVRMVRVKPTTKCCAAATGTIISAETISAPTMRIESVTVSTANTATSTLTIRTGSPEPRANPSSAVTAASRPDSPTPTPSTTIASTTEIRAPGAVTVDSDPKR